MLLPYLLGIGLVALRWFLLFSFLFLYDRQTESFRFDLAYRTLGNRGRRIASVKISRKFGRLSRTHRSDILREVGSRVKKREEGAVS